jgi:hypothetical protein
LVAAITRTSTAIVSLPPIRCSVRSCTWSSASVQRHTALYDPHPQVAQAAEKLIKGIGYKKMKW